MTTARTTQHGPRKGAAARARKPPRAAGGAAASSRAPAAPSPPRPAAVTAGPARTCVACRQPGGRDDLLRLVEGPDGAIAVDARARLGGRGAWVHPTRGCLTTAAKRHAAERALKVAVRDDVTGDALVAGVRGALERQLGSLLLAARRTRALAVGALATTDALERQRVPLVLVAADAGDAARAVGEESEEQTAEAAGPTRAGAPRGGVTVRTFGTKTSLGALLGRGEVAILAVTAPRIAVQLATVVDRLAGLEG